PRTAHRQSCLRIAAEPPGRDARRRENRPDIRHRYAGKREPAAVCAQQAAADREFRALVRVAGTRDPCRQLRAPLSCCHHRDEGRGDTTLRSMYRNSPVSAEAAAIKIVLDVTRLVREGKLTAEQAEQLTALATRDLGVVAINILMSFGAIAVAAGILALN